MYDDMAANYIYFTNDKFVIVFYPPKENLMLFLSIYVALQTANAKHTFPYLFVMRMTDNKDSAG